MGAAHLKISLTIKCFALGRARIEGRNRARFGLCACLDRVGILDLTDPEFQIPVVRVHVPGLEGYLTQHYSPGARARHFTEREAA